MAIVLRWIDWAITALTLRIYVRARHILAHSHLLRMRKLILKLILLIHIATLASTLVSWGNVSDSNGVRWLWVDAYTTCILNTALDTLLINVGSRIQRSRHICWLHGLLTGATVLSGPHWRHSKSTSLRHTVCLHILHLLRLRWIGHAAAFILRTGHLLKWVVSAVSLALGLIWSAKRTACPLSLLLINTSWIHGHILLVAFSILVLIDVIYLDVIKAVVEVSYV